MKVEDKKLLEDLKSQLKDTINYKKSFEKDKQLKLKNNIAINQGLYERKIYSYNRNINQLKEHIRTIKQKQFQN